MAIIVGAKAVRIDKDGKGKWSQEGRMNPMAMFFIIGSLALVVILPAILFVSLVWTHRPDLSLLDIFRESMTEIGTIIKSKTHKTHINTADREKTGSGKETE